MLNRLTIFFVTIVCISNSFDAHASDFQSPRTTALGGAGHAGPLLSDAIYLNPSFTSFIQTHSLSFNYLTYGGAQINTPGGISDFYGNNMNVSVLDGTPDSLFQAGVGYTRREGGSFLHVGASKSLFQRLGIGLGGKFIFPNNSSGERINEASLSVSLILAQWLQSSLIVDNLFESAANRGFYREVILGTKFNIMKIFFIYLDPHWVPNLPTNPWGYEAGVEFPFSSDFYLRLGSFKDSTIPYQNQRGDGYGAGVGWIGPRLSLDYSYSRITHPLSTMSHNFGITMYF